MTIWILTVVMLLSLAGLGYRQGAIRVGFSLVAILLGAVIAVPVGRLLAPLLPKIGVTNPLVAWWLPSLFVFALVLVIFKVAGSVVHKKVEVHYKYKAGDLRLALWERLMRFTGLCLALVNGVAYLILISLVIYLVSYWTWQLATPESDSWKVKLVNQLGKDLHSTGFAKVAASIDRTSDAFFGSADLAGIVFQSPSAEPRLSGYPALLGLSELPKFQELGADAQFNQLRQSGASIEEIIAHPTVQQIIKDPGLVDSIEAGIIPNLQDLTNYMQTGISLKYQSEPILGRWIFDANASGTLLRSEKPNLSANQAAQTRRAMAITYARTIFVATPERKVFLKNIPRITPGMTTPELQTVQGEWSGGNGNYEIRLSVDGRALRMRGEIMGSRLAVTGEDPPLAFLRME